MRIDLNPKTLLGFTMDGGCIAGRIVLTCVMNLNSILTYLSAAEERNELLNKNMSSAQKHLVQTDY